MKWFKRPRSVNQAGEVEYDYENSMEIHRYHGRDPVVVSFENEDTVDMDLQSSNGNRNSKFQGEDVEVAKAKTSNWTKSAQLKGKGKPQGTFCCPPGETPVSMQSELDPREKRAPFEEQVGEKIHSIEPASDSEFDRAQSDEDRTSQSSLSLHEARGMGPLRDLREFKNGKFGRAPLLVGLLCLLIAAFIGTVTGLVLRNKANKSQSSNSSSINSSSNSSSNGDGDSDSDSDSKSNNTNTSNATVSDRRMMFRDLLVNTSNALFSEESTPQAKALNWIVDEDPAALSLDTATADVIRERFAVACLYFATNGAEWTSDLGFLSADSICNWNDGESLGIFCDESSQSPLEMNIVDNNLSGGAIPGDLNYLAGLQTLKLYYNRITGEIPDLSQLVNLEHLDLDGNLLSGVAPTSLFLLPSIVKLFLLNNKNLTGTIPDITSSSRIESISLYECSFTGSLPASLGGVTGLRLLQLKNNAISGTIPPELFALPNLESVGLHGNRLTGSIPSFGGNGMKLEYISLGVNQLEGSLPDGIEELVSLQLFYLHENRLTGTIGSELVELPSLQALWLHDNQFTGNLPGFSGSSNVLEEVYLSGNDLEGNMDDFLATAPSGIIKVDFSGNSRIGGSISSDIGRFASSLQYFNASYCALSGSLPGSSLSDLTQVTAFAVAGNGLTGQIPTEIGNMVGLNSLDVSLNAFTGDIPDELSRLTGLTYLDVSKNSFLAGDLTNVVCDTLGGEVFSFLAADCAAGDTVQVECDCCTVCCNEEGQCSPNE